MAERWMSVAEAAKMLGISATTVRRRAQREQLVSRIGPEGRLEIRLASPSSQNEPTEQDDHSTEPAEEPTDAAVAAPAVAAAEPDAEPEPVEQAAEDAPQPELQSPKFGRYSPLPHGDAGITPQSGGRPTARLAPGDLLGQSDDAEGTGPEAELRRYQRLAGASMILAQRQADEAHEQVTLIRAESHAWRRWCQAAWAGVGVVVLLAMFVMGIVGHRASSAQAALQVQEHAVETAREAATRTARERDELQQYVRRLERQLDEQSRDRNASAH